MFIPDPRSRILDLELYYIPDLDLQHCIKCHVYHAGCAVLFDHIIMLIMGRTFYT
jgi:hypothetical protein